jgi:iron(III) transport system substrate-binding protein
MKRLIILLMLAACSPQGPQPPADPVVVYAAFTDDSAITAAFDRYKEETGVLVIVRRGPADRIVGDLIDNDVSPPADILMTDSVVPAWLAAEESALRPLVSATLRDRVPAWARDADDLWFGTRFHGAAIVHNMPDTDLSGVQSFAALAEQRFAGALCLTSSGLAINRAIIAIMINDLGVRPTELIVRDWVKNLAAPPFENEARLVEAVQAGTCGVAIISEAAAIGSGLELQQPVTAYGDVATIGVGRHARNPEGASALVEWLITRVDTLQIDRDTPAERHNVSVVARNFDDAIRLAERARYP